MSRQKYKMINETIRFPQYICLEWVCLHENGLLFCLSSEQKKRQKLFSKKKNLIIIMKCTNTNAIIIRTMKGIPR